MTPEQDRAALESTPRPAGSERDRRVHGLATAGFGAIVGAYVGITQALPRDNGAVSLITAGYVGLLIALAFWQKRADLYGDTAGLPRRIIETLADHGIALPRAPLDDWRRHFRCPTHAPAA